MDLHKAPKQFCENVTVGFAEDYFVAAFLSGQNASVYSFTPQHAKRLKQYLEKKIEDYEEKYGEIEAEWTPNIKSPLQRDDVSGSGGVQGEQDGET